MEVGQYRIGAIIQARLGSTRLPNKVLMELPIGSNNTLLSNIINSIKNVDEISKVIVASSNSSENEELENYVKELSVDCFRGEENDVLSRFYEVSLKNNFDYVLRLTGDNPVIDIASLKEFIRNFINKKLDYSCSENLPLGCNFEIMTVAQIKKAYMSTQAAYDREHVTPFIKRNAAKKENYSFKEIDVFKKMRLTIDYPSDFAFMNIIYSLLVNEDKSLKNIKKLVEKNIWLLEINKSNFQKKEYKNINEELEDLLPILKERELKRVEKLIMDEKSKNNF